MSRGASAIEPLAVAPRRAESGKVEVFRARPGRVRSVLRAYPLGVVGAAILLVVILAALLAGRVSPYDPVSSDFLAILQPPGPKHLLGTDGFGRDVFSRLLYGARTALLVGLSGSVAAATLGAAIGVTTGYFGGLADLIIERFSEILLAFPLVVLALALVAAFGGGGLGSVILAVIVVSVPRVARVVRASVLSVRELPYVEAARALGAGHVAVMVRHILPNVLAPYLIMLTALLGQAILLESSLSFLGLGVAEPTPAWGLMLRGSATQFAERAPWLAIAPGAAISLAVFAFNFVGDALRDALDPRLRVS
jgi:peptide/nickel transport system permease protein